MLEVPATWDDVTADWMTAALGPALPGTEVRDVELLLRDDGTNRRARFGLSYAHGAGPSTVFLKAADPEHSALNRADGRCLQRAAILPRGRCAAD